MPSVPTNGVPVPTNGVPSAEFLDDPRLMGCPTYDLDLGRGSVSSLHHVDRTAARWTYDESRTCGITNDALCRDRQSW